MSDTKLAKRKTEINLEKLTITLDGVTHDLSGVTTSVRNAIALRQIARDLTHAADPAAHVAKLHGPDALVVKRGRTAKVDEWAHTVAHVNTEAAMREAGHKGRVAELPEYAAAFEATLAKVTPDVVKSAKKIGRYLVAHEKRLGSNTGLVSLDAKPAVATEPPAGFGTSSLAAAA